MTQFLSSCLWPSTCQGPALKGTPLYIILFIKFTVIVVK